MLSLRGHLGDGAPCDEMLTEPFELRARLLPMRELPRANCTAKWGELKAMV